MELYRKGKTRITAKFCGSDLVICSRSSEEKMPSYSRRNMVDEYQNVLMDGYRDKKAVWETPNDESIWY